MARPFLRLLKPPVLWGGLGKAKMLEYLSMLSRKNGVDRPTPEREWRS